MSKKVLIVLFVFIFPAIIFAQNKSVYSDLTPDKCKGEASRNFPGLYFAKCKGAGGYDLEYYLDDERNSLGIVFPSKKVIALNLWNYFRDFSELGSTAEWRMKEDKPVALIIRLNVSDRKDETKQTSYLIVSKISREIACVTDVVYPGKNQNLKARQLADRSSTKKCLIEYSQTQNTENAELPAGIAEWEGEGSDKLLSHPVINRRLRKLLGEKNYESFLESFETLNPIKKTGNIIFGSGCMIRACGHLESVIAVDLENKTIHAAIFNEIEKTKYFNEKDSETPEAIINWATRLENLKTSDTSNDTETNQPEAILIDEFIYGNREEMMARIDNFTNNLQNDPTATGYIILSGDKKSRTTAEREIKNYLKQRSLNLNRFELLNRDGNSKAVIELWLVPAGAEPPEPKKRGDQKDSVGSKIIALEKKAWQAWKNKDIAFFQTFLADDALSANAGGISDKAEVLKYYGSCEVKSYSLDNFKFRMLGNDSALITFTAAQDAVCGGEKNPTNVRASSVYVKRGGKWLNSFYTETEIAQTDESSVESRIIALEKASWAAWQKKDGSWFENNLANDWLLVNSFEVETKPEIVGGIATDCEVKSFSLDNFRFVMLTKDSALVTYNATQDAACEGNTLPKTVRSTAVYVNRGGRWLQSLYKETQLIK